MNEPSEWKNYDASSLPQLLRHDSWNAATALPLIAGIDPVRSEIFYPAKYYNMDTDLAYAEGRPDPLVFWEVQFLSSPPGHMVRAWYEGNDWDKPGVGMYDRSGNMIEYFEDDTPRALLKERPDSLEAIRAIFESNSWHRTEGYGSYCERPIYFIEWAAQKNIKIEWLEWAKDRGLLPESTKATTETDAEPQSKADSKRIDPRWEKSLLALIGALIGELNIDPTEKSSIRDIEKRTENWGAALSRNTVEKILKKIPNAVHEVQSRKRS